MTLSRHPDIASAEGKNIHLVAQLFQMALVQGNIICHAADMRFIHISHHSNTHMHLYKRKMRIRQAEMPDGKMQLCATIERHSHLPSTERLSLLAATILLAYAIGHLIQLPALSLATQLPGIFLSVQLNVQVLVP